ncbi:hypothetical protein OS493_029536 [Desmophyllum pertusum]|uniref:Uncharacterized protein n=1 Tax=Desmophyllum pertusum TaxID=174260 RepID=A0A9W9YAH0_9CNID|nr:hypothetical protein OS493_029536 [Desmophyllum pertusum]
MVSLNFQPGNLDAVLSSQQVDLYPISGSTHELSQQKTKYTVVKKEELESLDDQSKDNRQEKYQMNLHEKKAMPFNHQEPDKGFDLPST